MEKKFFVDQPVLPGFQPSLSKFEATRGRGARVFPTLREMATGRACMANLHAMAELGRQVLDGEIDWRNPSDIDEAIARARGGIQKPFDF